jgi:hypothetical protein
MCAQEHGLKPPSPVRREDLASAKGIQPGVEPLSSLRNKARMHRRDIDVQPSHSLAERQLAATMWSESGSGPISTASNDRSRKILARVGDNLTGWIELLYK